MTFWVLYYIVAFLLLIVGWTVIFRDTYSVKETIERVCTWGLVCTLWPIALAFLVGVVIYASYTEGT